MRQLDIEVLNITDARCNREAYSWVNLKWIHRRNENSKISDRQGVNLLPYPDGGAATFLASGCHFCDNLNVYGISSTAVIYEGWNFNSGNYLFTTDTK